MKNFKEKYGPWALVTGASTGIGKSIAYELAERGLNIIAVARRQSLLDELQQELTDKFAVEVRTISADLSDADSISLLAQATDELEVGLVVPNAGIEVSGEFIASNMADNNRLLSLNMQAPMQIAHYFGAKMAKRGRGGILFISSLFGYQGIPYVAHYAASKAYILALGEALNFELKTQGVDVTVLSPGLTATDMTDNMKIDFKKLPIFSQKPKKVAKIGIKALGRKATIVPGFVNKFYAWENRFIPRSYPVKLFGFLIKRALKNKPL